MGLVKTTPELLATNIMSLRDIGKAPVAKNALPSIVSWNITVPLIS